MYELVQAAENTYYMDCPAKVGIVKTSDDEVVLIDSGSDKDAGKKVKRLLDSQGWKLQAIFNTHSHADHIGGNQYLQSQTGCRIYAPGIESCFTEYPELEPAMLYGGYALSEMHNKFLQAKESMAEKLTEAALPEGMELIKLPGHCYDMVGFRTKDNVVFLADCLSSKETLSKYQIGYIYDVKAYLSTLENVKLLKADVFVPSHAEPAGSIAQLAQFNIDHTNEISEILKEIVSVPKTFDDILSEVFSRFQLTMSLQQNMLVGSTVKSYLSYLVNEGQIEFSFEDNKMLWQDTQGRS